jgi:hypothetical protein
MATPLITRPKIAAAAAQTVVDMAEMIGGRNAIPGNGRWTPAQILARTAEI